MISVRSTPMMVASVSEGAPRHASLSKETQATLLWIVWVLAVIFLLLLLGLLLQHEGVSQNYKNGLARWETKNKQEADLERHSSSGELRTESEARQQQATLVEMTKSIDATLAASATKRSAGGVA